MIFLVPLGGFIFVVAGLGALNSIRHDEGFGAEAFFSALGFAVMVFCWVALTAH